LSQIHNNLSRLLEILEAEFKLLQTDNLDGFETLQAEKQVIVEALSEKLTPTDINDDYNVADDDSDDSNVKSMLAMCRDYHLRNGILLEKKIEVNKNALNILRSSRHSDEVETYDKLGKVRNPKSVGLQSDA
jgi:flagellar biosynthesis/type III secretory pathway chaperone|tara:strand:+ start:240 stop:635 length:396 start_codon:yes stop_codon:yes gene_type:complete